MVLKSCNCFHTAMTFREALINTSLLEKRVCQRNARKPSVFCRFHQGLWLERLVNPCQRAYLLYFFCAVG